jgi:hypothetical protein
VRAALLAALGIAVAGGVMSAPPTHAADPAPDPFFGTWSDGMSIAAQQSRTASRARLDDIASNGTGLVRQYVWWDRIETSPGKYDWTVMDQLVEDATARGITILPTLLYTPPFYRTSEPAGSKGLYPPDDPQKLADFATKMVERYGTHGTYWGCTELPVVGWQCDDPYRPLLLWEVWNEPDYPSWWRNDPDAAEYLDLLKPVYGAIKAADPDAQVALGSLTNAGGGTSDGYLDQLYELGGGDYFDVLSLNPYGYDVGAMMAYVRGMRTVAAAHGDAAKPLLITEYAWATVAESTSYITAEPGCQAALLHAATRELSQRRTELNLLAVIQFQWHDVPTTSRSWPFHAGLRKADGSAKPALAAYRQAVAGQAPPAGATLEACPEDRRTLDGQLHSLSVSASGSGSGTVTSTSPRGLSCRDECALEVPRMPVTLTVTPDDGSTVVDWTGVDCAGTSCTFLLEKATDVGVVFGLPDDPEAVAAPGRYEEDATPLFYFGEWTTRTSASDSGGAARTTSNAQDRLKMTFDGSQVRWVSRTGPRNGIARVFIDGVRAGTVDLYSAERRHARRVFDSGVLTEGRHVIRIVHAGRADRRSKGEAIWVDALVVR